MSTQAVPVPVKFARRMPDPNFPTAERHFLLVPASQLPDGLLRGANPRDPNVSRPVYRQVARSLRDQDDSPHGSFHLKHRGIRIVASDVRKLTERSGDSLEVYEVVFPEADELCGIVDGGHSYEIIREANARGETPPDQYVELQILTGVPESLVTDIAGGLNTSIQVQLKSLEDLRNHFDFLKQALGEEWSAKIAWHEGDIGEVDVVDVIAMLSCFDTVSHPGRESHPVDAYRRKKSQLEAFVRDPDKYRRLAPLARDILWLHDWIASDSENRWKAIGGSSGQGARYGALEMVETAPSGSSSPFLGMAGTYRLRRPAVVPILAAFRVLVEDDPHGPPVGAYRPARWVGGFDNVKALWEAVGGKLLRIFYDHWASTGRDLHAAGRSSALWNALFTELTVSKMERSTGTR